MARRLIQVLVVVCLLALVIIALGQQPEKKQPKHFGLANLLDFKKFKKHFKKNYTSTLEDLSRQKLYMTRLLRAGSSALAFIQHKSTSYLSINQMSDWTRKEFEKTLLDQTKRKVVDVDRADEKKKKTKALLAFIKRPLNFSGRKKNNKTIEVGLAANNKTIEADTKEDTKMFRLSSSSSSSPPNLDQQEQQDEQQAKEKANIKLMKHLHSTIKIVSPKASSMISRVTGLMKANRDHRQSGCLLGEPKDQGQCGSCYIFSTMAMFEWMYCMGTGGIGREFSEQYVLDCGSRMGVSGCSSGGNEGLVALFSKKYGFEFGTRYGYEARKSKCPYGNNQSSKSMGVGRFLDASIKRIQHNQWDEFLDKGPILIGVYVSAKFQEYGGGVDDGDACQSPERKYGHAMLLIGDGKENGIDYWLLRNSHGSAWGEKGYYKLAKSSKCTQLDEGIGYVPATLYYNENDYTFQWNPLYDESIIENRAQQKKGFFEWIFGG